MVEFRDGRQDSRGSRTNDNGLSGQIFGDGNKRERNDRNDNRPGGNDNRPGGNNNDNRPQERRQFDFTPPNIPTRQREQQQRPTIQPGEQNPQRKNPREQFPNFPNIPNIPTRDNRPSDNRPADNRPVVPQRNDNRPQFPSLPQAFTPEANPQRQRDNRPGQRPDTTPPAVTPDQNIRPRPEFPDLRPMVRPEQKRPQVQPQSDQNLRPKVQPQVITPPQFNPSDFRPRQPQQHTPEFRPVQPQQNDFRPQVQPQPTTDFRPQQQQQRPNTRDVVGRLAADFLLGPQRQQPAGYYPDGTPYYPPQGGYNPGFNPGYRPGGFAPQRQLTPNAVVNELVRNFIDPNGQNIRPDCGPGGYPPGYDPRYNPGYDPRYNPGQDPRYNPRYNPGYDPGYNPGGYYPPGGYRPQFQPRQMTVRNLVGEVVRDLIAPGYGPGYGPGGYPSDCGPGGQCPPQYYPNDYAPGQYSPGCSPGMYPTDLAPNRFPGARIAPPGGLRNLIRDIQNNPQGLEGLIGNLGALTQDMRFHVDPERREVSLGMDFTRAYDMISQRQGTPQNPEVRRVLAGLDSVQLNPDMLNMNWKSEQVIALDPNKPDGMKVLLGGGTNRTTFNIQSSDTRLVLSNMQGIEAVDPSGRRIKIYGVDVDTSDTTAPPKVTIAMDNPIAPGQAPVSITLPLAGAEQKQMADALPGVVRSINSMRNAAINGDLSQLDLAGLLRPKTNPNFPPQPEYRPQVPPVPQPQVQPDYVPAPPQPGIRPEVQPQVVRPEVAPQTAIPRPNLGVVDYINVIPAHVKVRPTQVEPQTVVPPRDAIVPPQIVTPTIVPQRTDTIFQPPAAPVQKVTPSLLPEQPVAPPEQKVTPPVVVPSEQPIAPPAVPVRPSEQPTFPTGNRRERPSDILRENGGKAVAAEKIGPDKLFSMVFADADQQGPLVKGFTAKMNDTRFRQNLDSVGSTLNRFDVDHQRKAITVGLDFSKAYDTFEDQGKARPETRAFLANLQTVTVTPEQLRMRFNGPSMLPGEGDGIKKADLWMGTNNGETTFDISSTDTSLTMKNITGLQAEVQVLGKKLNVYEVNIDTSSGTPVATATIDNPFNVVGGGIQEPTIKYPLELGKTPQEQAEVAQRLPQTLKSLNSMRQGALSGAMAERIGKLTKDEIIGMLKFK